MRVVCLEGSHGCGKTETINKLKALGYNTLDEGFLDMPQFTLHPQSFVMESIWVSKWVERILRIQKDRPDALYFADRSPFSVLLYALRGHLLTPALLQIMDELLVAGIEIVTVYLRVDAETLWSRIQDRLAREPEREKYNEGDCLHMQRAINFYEEHTSLWKYILQNNESVDQIIPGVEKVAREPSAHI